MLLRIRSKIVGSAILVLLDISDVVLPYLREDIVHQCP